MYKTEQEDFWSGKFGDDYVDRNSDNQLFYNNIVLFSKILHCVPGGGISVIEFGANIGLNLKAIKTLIPTAECSAVEINHKAADILRKWLDNTNVFEKSILDYESPNQYDFVLIKGVLIHINPQELSNVYTKLYNSSKRYICIVEYYNPTPTTVEYRGNTNRLFKRDFAGEIMDQYPDLTLVDYGFVYHRDNNFKQDDLTWFLLEKK